MNNFKNPVVIVLTVLLLISLISVSVMGKVIYDFHKTNQSLEEKFDLIFGEIDQTVASKSSDSEPEKAQVKADKTEYTYENIKGCYEVEYPNPSGEYPYHLYLQLKENGSYYYTRGSGGHSGIIGYYTIKENTLTLHQQFATGMDVSLGALDEGEYNLTINDDGSITDSTRFVSGFSDRKSAVLKKVSDEDPDINNNNTVKYTAADNAIFPE